MLERSLEYYREAYTKSKHPDVALGFAYVEHYLGNNNESLTIIQKLADSGIKLSKGHLDDLKKLEGMLTEKNQ